MGAYVNGEWRGCCLCLNLMGDETAPCPKETECKSGGGYSLFQDYTAATGRLPAEFEKALNDNFWELLA